jgi:cytochrome c biogenesis protein CcmG/thiol:disulfide interchange protein DsbE
MGMRRVLLWLPLALFVAVLGLVWSGLLSPADRTVKSALVGKPFPVLALPAAVSGKPGLDANAFRAGEPRLVNIFASWCLPCIAEAPQLLRLKAMGVKIDAIAVRDSEANLRGFLARNGDPYDRIGDDKNSAAQLALGSSGVPETFVVDGNGVIVAQHIGDIREDDIARLVAALGEAR